MDAPIASASIPRTWNSSRVRKTSFAENLQRLITLPLRTVRAGTLTTKRTPSSILVARVVAADATPTDKTRFEPERHQKNAKRGFSTTASGTRRVSVLVVLILAGLGAFALAPAARANSQPSVHRYQTGKRVVALQWLLSGHKPSRFRIIAYRGPINGHYDLRTARAVRNLKWRIGFPRRSVNGSSVGPFFFSVVKGKVNRPTIWLRRVTVRLAYLRRIKEQRARTDCARKVIAEAQKLLGIHEVPWGSNDGPAVRMIQSATGAYRAPWCVSTVQYIFKKARIGSPRAWSRSIGDNTAGAFYLASWARQHGWLRAVPRPAFIVVFLDRLGHAGTVESVSRNGFTSIEGNASNSVLRRFHPYGARPEVFIAVPGCDTG